MTLPMRPRQQPAAVTVPAPGTHDDPPARLCKDSFLPFTNLESAV
ncbi:hypothetical protein CBM2587_A10214 [Cupriavidus taiwanensis]|uniref:Uncharacterized protein n=1 Tax=Cupriavidus taiwanensis TaxID=164546 RepID=A0A375BCA4_9BURK|nr:hypothetical protein CBM2587_A10214 [Cupriavidus taiwanensis]